MYTEYIKKVINGIGRFTEINQLRAQAQTTNSPFCISMVSCIITIVHEIEDSLLEVFENSDDEKLFNEEF